MVFTIRTTIEVLGYPENHIKNTANKVIEKLEKEEGFKIIKKTIEGPEKIKEQFFACSIDLELKINDFSKLLHFCYDYLPSSIEILDAEKITLSIREFSMGINEVVAKLHHYNLVMNQLSTKLLELKNKEK